MDCANCGRPIKRGEFYRDGAHADCSRLANTIMSEAPIRPMSIPLVNNSKAGRKLRVVRVYPTPHWADNETAKLGLRAAGEKSGYVLLNDGRECIINAATLFADDVEVWLTKLTSASTGELSQV